MPLSYELDQAISQVNAEAVLSNLEQGSRPWGDATSPGSISFALTHPNWNAALSDSGELGKHTQAATAAMVNVEPESPEEIHNTIQSRLLSIQIDHRHLFIFSFMTQAFAEKELAVSALTLGAFQSRYLQSTLFHDLLKEGAAWKKVRLLLNQDTEASHRFAKQMVDAQSEAMKEAQEYVASFDFSIFPPVSTQQNEESAKGFKAAKEFLNTNKGGPMQEKTGW